MAPVSFRAVPGSKQARQQFAARAGSDSNLLLSTAVYCRIRKEPVPLRCHWCDQQEAAAWDHLVWHCPGFQSPRPNMPRTSMACRLGWAPRSYSIRDAAKLLRHVAVVQEQVERLS